MFPPFLFQTLNIPFAALKHRFLPFPHDRFFKNVPEYVDNMRSGQLQSTHVTPDICLNTSLFCGKFFAICKGIARTQSPTIKNYALELPTFGVIVGVSLTGVQWKGLTLEEPPSWSWLTSAPGKYAQCLHPLWPMNPDPEDQLKQDKDMLSGASSYTFTFYL